MRQFLLLMALIASVSIAAAKGYTPQQEKLRTQIESFLKEEGYTTERQTDGLKFRSNNDVYYIEIDSQETSPMYLRLCRYVKFDDNLKRENVMSNINDLNAKYCVKLHCKEKSAVLTAEMFVTQASQFRQAFPDLMKQIKSAYSKMVD
ncbi:MAG: hypothetical protein LUD17_11085 [Bacteroidales bacterium]|nr:hypothetical protein [Bacteroidales bacterium]